MAASSCLSQNGEFGHPKSANNADGNREIFLIDYAQRRIFQLTNTKNVQKPPRESDSDTDTYSDTNTESDADTDPTPTPSPTPPDPSLVKIEISNNRPMISFEPALVAGKRVLHDRLQFKRSQSGNFDGTDSAALVADGNQEIWIYQLPEDRRCL